MWATDILKNIFPKKAHILRWIRKTSINVMQTTTAIKLVFQYLLFYL